MAGSKARSGAEENGAGNVETGDFRRLTNLVALLLVKGENQTEKIKTLSAAGYPVGELLPSSGQRQIQ